jgi:ribosomal protein S18 acetylase RimI-like enzyme
LVVGAADDRAEVEADRVAGEVMRRLNRGSMSPVDTGEARPGRIRRREQGGDVGIRVDDDAAGETRITAHEGTGAVGSARARTTADGSLEVTDLEVAPAHRGRGHGDEILSAAARHAQRSGASRIVLNAHDDGSGHLDRWYRSLGFEGTGDDRSATPLLAASPSRLVRSTVAHRARTHAAPQQRMIRRMKRIAPDGDERPGKRPRKTPARFEGGEDVDKAMRENPGGFGLREEDVEKEIASNDLRENKADDSTKGTRGGMSGTARSEKGDKALVMWLTGERVPDSNEMVLRLRELLKPIRHTLVDRDDAVTSDRRPDQQEALSYLPGAALAELAEVATMFGLRPGAPGWQDAVQAKLRELQKGVSANRVLVHEKSKTGMDHGGFEILHMSARGVGNPTLLLPPEAVGDMFLPESMVDWTKRTNSKNETFSPAQHPQNLAIGSYAANTLMMAVEGAVSKAVKGVVLETWAYAPRGPQHVASHIVMRVEHKASGNSRLYYIPGTARSAPVEVYSHMEANAKAFLEDCETAGPETHDRSTYEYPTSDDLLAQRAKVQAAVAKSAASTTGVGGPTSGATATTGGPPISAPTIPVNGGVLHLNTTAGAGNCFFHSLHESSTGQRSSSVAQQEMREDALDAVRATPGLAQSHFGGTGTPEYQEFALTLLLEGHWVENTTPGIIADALGWEIIIHRPDGSVLIAFQPNARFSPVVVRTVHLWYDGGHYNSYTPNALP